MKEKFNELIPSTIRKKVIKIYNYYWAHYSNDSYSQEGEDLILKKIFGDKKNGFYIDVGAHHPQRFSNTYYFYRQGWRGINIDAMPGSMYAFNRIRPDDLNLEIPISNKRDVLTYYSFEEPALNGFSVNLNVERAKKNKIISKTNMETKTLEEVLDLWFNSSEIDFLSIDVEGLDFQVLNSNNWTKYRPKVVLVESLKKSIENCYNDEMACYMKKNGYIIFAKTFNTVFFMETNFFNRRLNVDNEGE
ncbi:FkbM family methyltransferase [Methanohalophilus mahii]|uniref:Putative SAM-dependent methyltransferase n=1 Tax=Methanohalophilus mahii (strain ATCC 35705 / DSM 5219 / SLP) TaxID=547558 RepID=D5E8W1_METMS|nr:FkbM family methyltransferase [Methanohalophilus mahii]ADE35620.1 putative SAM-dependent methyltransferase [Methanohalophilus mahii DSM 5219]